MKKTIVVASIVALGVLCVEHLWGQITNFTPHNPIIIATYDFDNLTASLEPITVLSPSDSGFYRVSIYMTPGSNAVPNPLTPSVVCTQLMFPSDAGAPGTYAIPSDSTGGNSCIEMAGSLGVTLYGAAPLHVRRNTKVQLATQYLPGPHAPYSLYVVVEKL